MNYQFQKPARPVSRVFLHCSASDNPNHDSAAVMDRWHRERGWSGIGYHFFIRKDGTLEIGRDLEKVPAAQEGNNTGTIAICLHGLEKDKFTEAQFRTLWKLCDQINRAYAGKVTFHGHCEVAAKACPVFDYRALLGLNRAGKVMVAAQDITSANGSEAGISTLGAKPAGAPVLRIGMKGPDVRALQALLTQLGYFTGTIDSDFGPRTRAAVLAFQADNGLDPDGKVGQMTRAALGVAPQRQIAPARAFASLTDLAATGSRIARASQRNFAVGAVLGGGGLVAVIDEITGHASMIQKLFADHGLLTGAVILAAGAFVAWQSWRAGQARVEDHRTGKTA